MALPPSFQEFMKAVKRMQLEKLLVQTSSHMADMVWVPSSSTWCCECGTQRLFRMTSKTQISFPSSRDRSVCKVVARIFLGRLLDVAEEVISESAVFVGDMATPGKKPVNSEIHSSPSFGTSVLNLFGCPDHFADLIIALHDGMVGRVCTQNALSEPIPIPGDLKQSCVMAPTLFLIDLATMLSEILRDSPGVDVRYRLDNGLFNIACLRSKTRTSKSSIMELQYAEHNATSLFSVVDLRRCSTLVSEADYHFEIKVNTDKTNILAQPFPRRN